MIAFVFILAVVGLALLLLGVFGFVGVGMVLLGYASMIGGTSIFFPISISVALLLAGWFILEYAFYRAAK